MLDHGGQGRVGLSPLYQSSGSRGEPWPGPSEWQAPGGRDQLPGLGVCLQELKELQRDENPDILAVANEVSRGSLALAP